MLDRNILFGRVLLKSHDSSLLVLVLQHEVLTLLFFLVFFVGVDKACNLLFVQKVDSFEKDVKVHLDHLGVEQKGGKVRLVVELLLHR